MTEGSSPINIICLNDTSHSINQTNRGRYVRGAIIFLIVFVIALVITFGYQDLPPGRQIYDAIGGAETDYPILGIQATTLIIAPFNGVIYGFIAWLIYTLLDKAGIIPKKKNPSKR